MRKLICVLLILLGCLSVQGQNLEKSWQFQSIQNENNQSLFEINAAADVLKLDQGRFDYFLEAKDSLQAAGDYLHQNDLLVFFYTRPTDTIRRYRITTLTDSTLAFKENGITYSFVTPSTTTADAAASTTVTENNAPTEFVASQGFSLNSLRCYEFGGCIILSN